MRVERFKTWLADELTKRGVPVDRYEVAPGMTDLVVAGHQLRIVRTSTPGGEDFSAPEKIVERTAGTPIKVTRHE